MTTGEFIIYPAIDLRQGQVVRLVQGDPQRQTVYATDPAEVASRWLAEGAGWLHVVNLDGAFGESGLSNQTALQAILREAQSCLPAARVQFGGGLRSLGDIEKALTVGADRVVLGTLAAEDPQLAGQAVLAFGAERFVLGVDVRAGRLQVRGWAEDSAVDPLALASRYLQIGVRTCVFTNVGRDGLGCGVDVTATREFALATGMDTIASGGVATLEDVQGVRQAGLCGVIIGRALYENQVSLREALAL